jgi:GT2 family glycosyltransferase
MPNEIDVIIGTHNRHENLIEVLKAFKEISKTENIKFGVIVIDSSDERLGKKEQKLCATYIYDKSTKPLSVKRNLGIRKSKAEFIAFTDDDCIADKRWLAEIRKTFREKKCVCVTGRTVPYGEYGKSEYEKRFSFDKIQHAGRVRGYLELDGIRIINMSRIGHGNNMAFKRGIFKEVGFFDESRGVGTKKLAGEDADMFYRIYKKGKVIFHNPRALIYHKHLMSKEDVIKTAYRNAFSYRSIFLKHHDLNCIISYLFGLSRSVTRLLFYGLWGSEFQTKLNIHQLRGWLSMKEK